MKLIAYPSHERAPAIVPAPSTRPWLDFIPQKFAYRCLPLTIANSHGWQIECPLSFEAVWDGSKSKEGLKIGVTGDGDTDGDAASPWKPESHFGNGIMTMHPGYVFRTEPSVNLFVMGPPNHRKDGVQPLMGVVETDWSPYSFTMNWAMTRPHVPVRFEKGEPFCFIFPVPRGFLDSVEPEIRDMESTAPELAARHAAWKQSRTAFIEDVRKVGSEAHQQKWQKSYYLGEYQDGESAVADHQIKLQVEPFRDRRGTPGASAGASDGVDGPSSDEE